MPAGKPQPPLVAIALIAAAALGYEILLTRLFAIAHWHHLVAIAISLALLGYGASGTYLSLTGPRSPDRFEVFFFTNAGLFAISAWVCPMLALQIPFDPQAVAWDPRHMGYLSASFLFLAVPFFAAANCIGAALGQFGNAIPRIYGFDLIGAGVGAFALLGLLAALHPADALLAVIAGGFLAALLGAARLPKRLAPATLLLVALTSLAGFIGRPSIQPAPYKDLARAASVQGAMIEDKRTGVPGVVTVLRNETVPQRSAPGLSLQATASPPNRRRVFVDGEAAGSLADPETSSGTSNYFGHLLSALPFEMRPQARVAVIHAGAGLGIEQALTLGASKVTAIEPNHLVHSLVCEREHGHSLGTCDPRSVDWQLRSPRPFFASHTGEFDLITLSMHADPAGVDALDINFTTTHQALDDYLSRLSDAGLLAIEGPTRVPPRLSLRLLNTAHRALSDAGLQEPARHLALLRGWQRFLLIASPSALNARDQDAIRDFANRLGFDLVWLPNLRVNEVNRFQILPDPLFYEGAARLLGSPPGQGAHTAPYRLQAISDERPFPKLSTHWSELIAGLLKPDTAQWARLDTALLIAVLILMVVTAAAVVLILLPLLWMRPIAGPTARTGLCWRTLLFFTLIGLAFLFLELVWIQRTQLFLGHPVYATTTVLAAFLVFAGLGSLWSQRRNRQRTAHTLHQAVAVILVCSLVYGLWLPSVLEPLSSLGLAGRVLVVGLLLAPLAFAMGVPFPYALTQLAASAPQLVPWAWGINGCSSVIAAAAAPLLTLEFGFSGMTLAAVAAYLVLPALGLHQAARHQAT